MNMAAVIDTHRMVKRLVAKGFSEPMAEEFADIQKELVIDTMATKADLAAMESRLALGMATMKVDLIKWFFGVMIAFSGILLAGIKYL